MFYKIVRRFGGQLMSVNTSGYGCVTYGIDTISVAPDHLSKLGYHLFVFDSLHNALIFWTNVCAGHDELWECEVGEMVEVPELFIRIYELANNIDFDLSKPRDSHWPEGTRMTKSVKLTKIIPNPSKLAFPCTS